ncbi:MAG TPA: tRNA (adenosine(37)-N6)-dimethylallyltransferase MiaA, partial [Burkholderiales bacterium]|nr:tRNA (adenosine(37)-N6)-dimethylallyltransferase MiaA [Burkholderiales bacterium]
MKPICLMGPTASGKTAVAIELASTLPVEIISVDSALVFRHMDIGTAKPDSEILSAIPHHLVDIIDPDERYSAGRFRDDAARLVSDIIGRGKIPLLVGGTMLYFKALSEGLDELPKADPEIRAQIDDMARKKG